MDCGGVRAKYNIWMPCHQKKYAENVISKDTTVTFPLRPKVGIDRAERADNDP